MWIVRAAERCHRHSKRLLGRVGVAIDHAEVGVDEWPPGLEELRVIEQLRWSSVQASQAFAKIRGGQPRWTVISSGDLITAKLAAGRPQDLVDAAALRESARQQTARTNARENAGRDALENEGGRERR